MKSFENGILEGLKSGSFSRARHLYSPEDVANDEDALQEYLLALAESKANKRLNLEIKDTSATSRINWALIKQETDKKNAAGKARVVAAKEKLFYGIVEEWEEETGYKTYLRDKMLSRHYQRLLVMGKDAMPFLLRELKNSPKYWLPLLDTIASVHYQPYTDPIPKEHNGNRELIIQDWLNWAKEHNVKVA